MPVNVGLIGPVGPQPYNLQVENLGLKVGQLGLEREKLALQEQQVEKQKKQQDVKNKIDWIDTNLETRQLPERKKIEFINQKAELFGIDPINVDDSVAVRLEDEIISLNKRYDKIEKNSKKMGIKGETIVDNYSSDFEEILSMYGGIQSSNNAVEATRGRIDSMEKQSRISLEADQVTSQIIAANTSLDPERTKQWVEASFTEGKSPDQILTMAGLQKPGAGAKGFAPQVETKYIPVGNDKFQLVAIDRTNPEDTKPVLLDGAPVILSEKQVLIAEGKKAQSLIDPYKTSLLKKFGTDEGARLSELKKAANSSLKTKQIISDGIALIDKGIYSGAAANIRLSFDKWLQEVGINIGGKKAANTEAYAGLLARQVGEILGSGVFGGGTGLSDADREYAQKMAAGEIILTENSLRQLLAINDKVADLTITEYNRQSNQAKTSLLTKDYFKPIEVPVDRKGSTKTPNQGKHLLDNPEFWNK